MAMRAVLSAPPLHRPPRPRPVQLAPSMGRPFGLGAPDPSRVHAAVFDENGRPFPNVELSVVLPGPTTGSETRNVGATGETVIDVGTLPAGEKVVLTPNIPIDFASDPPFHEIEPGYNGPTEVSFVVARRQVERDYLTPIITFVAGGVITGVLMWGLDRLGVKL